MKKFHDDSGFTMIELAVTLAILSIVAAVAIPNISAWRSEYALREASQEVYAMLMQAKTEAMKRNRNCTAQFGTADPNGGGNIGIMLCTGIVPCDGAPDQNIIIGRAALPDGVVFGGGAIGGHCQMPLTNNVITFGANSVPRNPPVVGGISLTINGQQSSCVEISNAGNIAIY